MSTCAFVRLFKTPKCQNLPEDTTGVHIVAKIIFDFGCSSKPKNIGVIKSSK